MADHPEAKREREAPSNMEDVAWTVDCWQRMIGIVMHQRRVTDAIAAIQGDRNEGV